jgi:hypothetical protein
MDERVSVVAHIQAEEENVIIEVHGGSLRSETIQAIMNGELSEYVKELHILHDMDLAHETAKLIRKHLDEGKKHGEDCV